MVMISIHARIDAARDAHADPKAEEEEDSHNDPSECARSEAYNGGKLFSSVWIGHRHRCVTKYDTILLDDGCCCRCKLLGFGLFHNDDSRLCYSNNRLSSYGNRLSSYGNRLS